MTANFPVFGEMSGAKKQIIISGAGLVGCCMALSLARRGFCVLLIDPKEQLAPQGGSTSHRTVALNAASIALLDDLGFSPQSAGESQSVENMEISFSDAVRPTLTFASADLEGRPLAHVLANDTLYQRLLNALENEPLVTLVLGDKITALEQGAQIGVHLSEDKIGGKIDCDLVIACDGPLSATKSLAGITTESRDYKQAALVGTVTHQLEHGATAIQRLTPSGPIALLPLADQHRSSLIWSCPTEMAQQIAKGDQQSAEWAINDAVCNRFGTLEIVGELATFPLFAHQASRLSTSRFVSVGDAARSIHPLAGQGLNLALSDVLSLTKTLDKAWKAGEDIGALSVLQRYEKAREAEGKRLLMITDALNRWTTSKGPMRALSRLGMSLVEPHDLLKSWMMKEAMGEKIRV